MVRASSIDVTGRIAPGCRPALSKTRSTSVRARPAPSQPVERRGRSPPAGPDPARAPARRPCRGPRTPPTTAPPVCGNSTIHPVTRRLPTAHRAGKPLALKRDRVGGTAEPSAQRKPISAARPSAPIRQLAGAAPRAIVDGRLRRQAQQFLHPQRVRGRRRRQPGHDPGGQHRRAAQHLLGVVGQRCANPAAARSCREAGGAPSVGVAVDARPPAAAAARVRAARRPCTTSRRARSASKMPQ